MQKLTPAENTALGVAAGTIEVSLLQPMLYCKNATQQKLPFTIDPRILYRGTVPPDSRLQCVCVRARVWWVRHRGMSQAKRFVRGTNVCRTDGGMWDGKCVRHGGGV